MKVWHLPLCLVAGLALLACGGDAETPDAASAVELPPVTATAAPTATDTSTPQPATAEPPMPVPTVALAPQVAAATVPPPPTEQPQPTPVPPTAAPPVATVSNPNGVCIEASTPGQVIENLRIGPCGDVGIDVRADGVVVRNVTIVGAGIRVYEASGVLIEGTTISDPSDADDGYVQLISLDRASSVTIRNNTLRCSASCVQEDAIGIYYSSDVLVAGNSISGGNSVSGCGVLADEGSHRVTIRANVIRNQANCGIGIANGTGHVVEGNDVAGYGNVGIYVWNQHGSACGGIAVRNNVVTGSNPWWDGGGCGAVAVTGNSFTADD